jgi:hypothetical protein
LAKVAKEKQEEKAEAQDYTANAIVASSAEVKACILGSTVSYSSKSTNHRGQGSIKALDNLSGPYYPRRQKGDTPP